MRPIRSIVILATAVTAALSLSGCTLFFGEDVTSRSLTAAEQDHLASFTNTASKNYDPGLGAITNTGYSVPAYVGDGAGHRLYMVKCPTGMSTESCAKDVKPTVDAPFVVLNLKGAPPENGQFEFTGTFYLGYPNAKDGHKDNELKCELQGNAPAGAKRGTAGPWESLPNTFKEIGDYFTNQKYRDGGEGIADPATHTYTMSDGATWRCGWVLEV